MALTEDNYRALDAYTNALRDSGDYDDGELVQMRQAEIHRLEGEQQLNSMFGASIPTAPEFTAVEQYTPDSGAYDQFRQEAMRAPGQASAWATGQRAMSAIDRIQQDAQARLKAAQGASQARSGLAARGGLSSGASERIAQGGQQGYMGAYSNAMNQYNRDALNIGAKDEENRMSMLAQAPGMEMNRANYFQQAREKAAAEKNKFAQDKYGQQMGAWGAARTAQGVRDAAPMGD